MPKLHNLCEHCGGSVLYWPSNPRRYCSNSCYREANVSTFDHAAWHERNREDQNAKKAAWRLANPEKRKDIQRAYRTRNKELIAASTRLRRQIYKAGASRQDVDAIIAAAESHCTYCAQPVEKLELDHVQPVAGGGDHQLDNFIPACRTCNASKSDKVAEDWIFERFGVEGLGRAVVMLERRERLVLA